MKKRRIIIISLLFLVLLIIIPTFGRYVGKEIRNHYLASKDFYFNADKLTENGVVYQVENWSGLESYDVTFNLDSYKNNNVYAKSDISYTIKYSCSSNVRCDINKTSGIIYSSSHTDSFTITITPKKTLKDGEKAKIFVEVTSTSPYKKILKGEFNVAVGKIGLSYEILDESSSTYFETAITNTLDYYVARKRVDKYKVGDKIDVSTYQSLSDDMKKNFASAIVTIEFDPNVVLLDMTSKEYLNAISTTTTDIGGNEYINSLTFEVQALSSSRVKFYKVDSTQDYSYPYDNDESIVDVNFE